ncbi:MAG TPA: hypothetical protein VGI40_22540 [Pirellulaceae bacterium]
MMTAENLAAEQKTYENEKERLLAEGKAGKFVLISGSKIVGVWDTYDDALQVAYQQCGLDTRFLIKKIEGIEDVQFFSRDITACQV